MIEILAITIATAITIVCSFAKKRTHVLTCSFLCGSTYVLYWFLMGEMTAVAMSAIGAFGAIVQMCIPEQYLQRTMVPRIMFTLVLAAIGFAISYENINDVLPLMAFSVGRLAEIFSKPTSIRYGYMVNGSLWLSFSVTTNDQVAIAANLVTLSVQAYCSYRDMVLTPKAALKTA